MTATADAPADASADAPRDTRAGPPSAPAADAVFPGDSEMARRCRAFDWAATPLGPVERWPAALRAAAGLVVEAPLGMIVLWGPELVQLYNDAYRDVMGARHPGGLGQPTRECWPEVWAFNAPLYEGVTRRRETFTFEDQRLVIERHGHPEEAYFALTYSPVPDDAGGVGGVGGVLVTVVETTARVQARAAEAERTRLALALEAERTGLLEEVFRRSPSFLHILRGEDFVFEFANPAYYQLVGHRDLLGRPAFEAMPEAAAGDLPERIARVLATGEPFEGRELPVTLARTPGAPPEERLLDLVYLPLADASGARTRVLGHGIDVTDQVRARQRTEAALAERTAAAEAARADADRANRAKSEFLATMSHEIRTPINAIQGYAELLDLGIGGPVTPVQRDYLARLTTAGRHLLGLVNDVLDLAKVDAGELAVARDVCRTDAAVTAALDLVRPQAEARGVRLLDGNPDYTELYVGDEYRVRQILVNLLSNAVKFTEAGGTVRVTCTQADEAPPGAALHGAGPWACVRVSDTGVGIAPEQQAAVFEPFHQVEQGHTRTRGGTGLGLAISRRLARLMGGDLTLESVPGEGSTFTLWLPATGDARWGMDGADETAAARGARADRRAPLAMRGLADFGELLRGEIDAVLAAYAERLRADPVIPQARGMRRVALEDHLGSFLADLAQSLVLAEEAGAAAPDLLADGTAISRVIAERHGARRAAQGWDETAVRRDYAVLGEVLARILRARGRAAGGDVETALAVALGLVERAEAVSVAAWRAADAAA